MRNEYARDRDFIGRFLDEGRVLCALTHPNIGQILEVGQEATTQSYFGAMEPAAGIAEGQVLRVLQAGYMIGDRVVRHSRVVVAGPAPKS